MATPRRAIGWTVAALMTFHPAVVRAFPRVELPDPPELVSPTDGSAIPRNSQFVFNFANGTANSILMLAVVDDAEPFEVAPDLDSCGVRFACDGIVGPFDLQPGSELRLVVVDDNSGQDQEFTFTATDELDEISPVITGTVRTVETGIQAPGTSQSLGPLTVNWSCTVEKTVRFAPELAEDNNLVPPTHLVRERADGRDVLIGTARNADDVLVDAFPVDQTNVQACYRFIAWDVAGNLGESATSCIDIELDEEESESAAELQQYCDSSPPSCAQTGAGRAPTLPALLLLAIWTVRVARRRLLRG